MIADFTEAEKEQIRIAEAYLEKINDRDSNQVLAVIDLFYGMIDEKDDKIIQLKEELEEKENYIEDWQP